MASTDLPLVLPCRGGTSVSQLATDVAAALARLGVAETTQDAAVAVAAARHGRSVVALDGCASVCRARLLDARGVRARAELNLAELGADAAADVPRLAREAAQCFQQRRPTASPPARPRLAGPAASRVAAPSARPHDIGDYLLAIDALGSASVACGAVAADAPTLAAHVSQLLGVSRPSAGEALGRLQARGLVARGAQKQVVLTARGRLAADRVVRRQRLLERFAVDYLGYPAHECFERARDLERAFDDDAVERLRGRLGDPEHCPHGWPVDPLVARAENEALATLLALPEGTHTTIARIAERDEALVRRLLAFGALPGAEAVLERSAGRGGVALRLGGALRILDAEAASAVLVYGHGMEAGR